MVNIDPVQWSRPITVRLLMIYVVLYISTMSTRRQIPKHLLYDQSDTDCGSSSHSGGQRGHFSFLCERKKKTALLESVCVLCSSKSCKLIIHHSDLEGINSITDVLHGYRVSNGTEQRVTFNTRADNMDK